MTHFRFSLSFGCFVAFLGGTLEISATDSPQIRLSIDGIDYRFEGALERVAAERFHDLAVAALHSYPEDAAWREIGLDGTSYRGMFESSTHSRLEFEFWSPAVGTPPHRLARAALEAVPLDHPDERFEYSLKTLRKDLGISWVP